MPPTEEVVETDEVVETNLLCRLSAKQLVTKLIAYHRRRRKREARKHEIIKETQLALAGDRGRAECFDKVEMRYPDIGDQVQQICEDKGIGADAWRRDGCLTM